MKRGHDFSSTSDQLNDQEYAERFRRQHLHTLPHGEDSVKMIGVYSTREDAVEATRRLAAQPGSCDLPDVVNFDVDGDDQGFHIDEYQIGKDHWQEGYVTV